MAKKKSAETEETVEKPRHQINQEILANNFPGVAKWEEDKKEATSEQITEEAEQTPQV